MNISIVTVLKDLYGPFLHTSLLKRAQENGLVSFDVCSFFDFANTKERIDAPPFGHGAGMLIKPAVVQSAIEQQEKKHGKAYKIFFSPQGQKLDQRLCQSLAKTIQSQEHVMLIPARYEGMDARVEQEYADLVVSVGDFVLMGGDIPAMTLLEGVLRLVPGVVGKQESLEAESFTGPWLDYPEYTEPVVWKDKQVPDVIRSGNHGAVDTWRLEQAIDKTITTHFDWFRSQLLTKKQKELGRAHIPNHYVALMHDQVMIGSQELPGTTSVMSLDIHDIARSSATYGISNYFIITPLEDQQKIVSKFLNFWQEGDGVSYRSDRHSALKLVRLKKTLEQAIVEIEAKEGQKPLVIATSARFVAGVAPITFFDQQQVWQHKRPVLILFGTGNGLSEELVVQSDYILLPIDGLMEFNHLSVRSAAAIILDRWLGLQQKTLPE